jgi:hypothetical protein
MAEPDRQILVSALVSAYGDDEAQTILKDPHIYSPKQIAPGPVWDGLMDCWLFWRKGVGLVGVELDGYVHS